MYRPLLLILAFALFCILAAPVAISAPPDEPPLPQLPEGKQWKLAWNDEFNGAALDESKWEIFGARGPHKRRDGWWVKEDAYLDGKGNLVLRTKQEGDRYTCGAIRTRGNFEHTFGYWVARCKFQKEQGHWSAFWLMPTRGIGRVGNGGRDGAEIDIMEKPWLDDRLTQNLHWDGYGRDHKTSGTKFTVPGIMEGFHTFGFYWTAEGYVFDVDGKVTWRTNAGGASEAPSYVKLTEEIGAWGGDIKKAKLPDYFYADYVRVYDVVDKDGE